MGEYRKTAPGEQLTYQPENLSKYDGELFCLRITFEDMDLDRCFFVYLEEHVESDSLRMLIQTYFLNPKPASVDELESRLEPWLRVDSMLKKKYALLRQILTRMNSGAGRVEYYINHGPGPVNLQDTVASHLGTSIFADGSFNEKILDLVIKVHAINDRIPELDQWRQFSRSDTAGVTGPTQRVQRRSFLGKVAAGIMVVLLFPLMFFSCRDNNGRFGGGML